MLSPVIRGVIAGSLAAVVSCAPGAIDSGGADNPARSPETAGKSRPETAGKGGPEAAGETPAGAVVVLTFDDGLASQARAAELLREHGLTATFYVSSGLLGRPGRMTWRQVGELARAGHEIGGHTLTHARLDRLPPQEQRREICADRRALTARGHDARTLAYPYGAAGPQTARIAAECGYLGARAGTAKTTADPFAVPVTLTVTADTTRRTMERAVLAGERRGGRVTLVFHDVCADCGEYAVDPATLDGFLGWLAARQARGTRVLPLARALTDAGLVAGGSAGAAAPTPGPGAAAPARR